MSNSLHIFHHDIQLNMLGYNRKSASKILGVKIYYLDRLRNKYSDKVNFIHNGKKTVIKHIDPFKLGKLYVTSDSKRDNGRTYRYCICDCGNKLWILSSSLLRKDRPTLSCGCLHSNKKMLNTKNNLSREEVSKLATKNKVISNYKISAKRRGYSWELTDEEALELMAQNCYYCGQEPNNKAKLNKKDFVYNGIDRKDNTKGYTLDNCVPSCVICNRAKSNLPLQEWKMWIDRIKNMDWSL